MRQRRVCLVEKEDYCFYQHHCAQKSGYKRICRASKSAQHAILYKLERQCTTLALGAACGICGLQRERLCLDHDHATNKKRGFLCANCNKGLGMLKDDPEILAKAIEYLRCDLK